MLNLKQFQLLLVAGIFTLTMDGNSSEITTSKLDNLKTDLSNSKSYGEDGDIKVDLEKLVKWILDRNSNVLEQKMVTKAASFKVEAEDSLYEPVWVTNLNRSVDNRKRSSSEYLSFDVNAKTEQENKNSEISTGVYFPIPSGGDISINYKFSKQENSLFPEEIDKEYSSSVDIQYNQPLLKGFGRKVTEFNLTLTKLDEKISKLQHQQILMNVAQGASELYWQLYRAYKVVNIRQIALENAIKLEQDMINRVKRGNMARSELLEAQASIADREAELSRAHQVMTEVLTNIRINLNISKGDLAQFSLKPEQSPKFDQTTIKTLKTRVQYAINNHPQYLLKEIQHKQEKERYQYTLENDSPNLDLTLGYGYDNIDLEGDDAVDDTTIPKYRDWKVGISFKLPLGGDIRGQNEVNAQKILMEKSHHSYLSLQNQLRNDIEGRISQLNEAYKEIKKVEQSVLLYSELLAVEQSLFKHGRTRLRDVIERESLLNNAKQRFVEAAARVEIAKISLMVSDGSLLEYYGINGE